MIWQNPWAWLGLATVALPVIIHLLGRGHARVHRFPTLRFIDASRLLPTRRTRLSDLLIFAVRVSVLIAAAAALSQPVLVTGRRSTAANAALARAIIVDTSGNVTPAGRASLDSIQRENPLTRGASVATVIVTGEPSAAIPGAGEWLEQQPIRGEIAIISRFRRGALDSADIATIPARLGVRLVRVPSKAPESVERRTRTAENETVERITASDERTEVEWSARAAPADNVAPAIFASANEKSHAEAALRAAGTVPVALPLDSNSVIGVVEPGYEPRASLLANSIRPRRAWMMDIVARLAADSTLVEAGRRAAIVSTLGDTNAVVVARTDSRQPVVLAAENAAEGRERLLFFSLVDAGSLASAALIAGIRHASSMAPPAQWLEPSTIPEAQLARWQREPSVGSFPRRTSGDDATDGDSDGRWLWLAALALLALETWLRRERGATTTNNEVARERAA
jgi:hypothetical protein